MTQSPGEPRKQKVKSDRLNKATAPISDSAPLPSPPAQKKRKLAEDEEQPTANAEDAAESGAEAAESTAAEKEPTKAEKGKAKKRRKEEQRALVSALEPLAEQEPSRAVADGLHNVQENPPSFSFDTRGFKGGRMIQVKVSLAHRGRLHRCSRPTLFATGQDVRDFVLHLLSDEKAQQWLYVAVGSSAFASPFAAHLSLPLRTSATSAASSLPWPPVSQHPPSASPSPLTPPISPSASPFPLPPPPPRARRRLLPPFSPSSNRSSRTLALPGHLERRTRCTAATRPSQTVR